MKEPAEKSYSAKRGKGYSFHNNLLTLLWFFKKGLVKSDILNPHIQKGYIYTQKALKTFFFFLFFFFFIGDVKM